MTGVSRIRQCRHDLFFMWALLSFASIKAADSLPVMDTITVTEKRATPLGYERIDSSRINRVRHSRTVDGILTAGAGIDVKRSSPAGGKGRAVTLRGFDESRFLILLDGRPLNGSGVMGGHYVDWSSLSLDNISAIEVFRGPKSAVYGNALGGVVNIRTGNGLNRPENTTLTASYGIV